MTQAPSTLKTAEDDSTKRIEVPATIAGLKRGSSRDADRMKYGVEEEVIKQIINRLHEELVMNSSDSAMRIEIVVTFVDRHLYEDMVLKMQHLQNRLIDETRQLSRQLSLHELRRRISDTYPFAFEQRNAIVSSFIVDIEDTDLP